MEKHYQDFLVAYRNTLDRMDLSSIKGFTEFEMQTVYYDFWKENVIDPMLDISEFRPLNPSVLRSMLVMDLYDLHLLEANKQEVARLFEWYVSQLKRFYSSDIFSLYHSKIELESSEFFRLSDLQYFGICLPRDTNVDGYIGNEMLKLMSRLFIESYNRFGDIFADNGYFVHGPYISGEYLFQITEFKHVISTPIKFIQMKPFKYGSEVGVVDMFGHSTVAFNNSESSIVMEYGGEILGIEVLDMGEEHKKYIEIKHNIESELGSSHPPGTLSDYVKSRMFRYKEHMLNGKSGEEILNEFDDYLSEGDITLSPRIIDVPIIYQIYESLLLKDVRLKTV